MPDGIDVESRTFAERVVLLGLVDLSNAGDAPARSFEVREACLRYVDDADGGVLGRLAESEIVRALNRLEATDLVVQTDAGSRSAVGKGRPRYDLAVDPAAVVGGLADDDRLDGAVEDARRTE
jgi:hypothetical protein